jgi:hypothetical protein
MMIDATNGQEPMCEVDVPYPSPRCGALIVQCMECGLKVGITVAGRTDDVRRLRMPCKLGQMQ